MTGAGTPVGVSIVTYRSRPAPLELTLRGLAGWRLPGGIRLHLHANAASAGHAAELGELAERVAPRVPATVSWTATNLGFAAAHNRGLQLLFAHGCRAVVVHNPDLVLAPDAAGRLLAAAGQLGTALIGPLLELADPDDLSGTGRVDTMGIRWTAGGRHLDDRQGAPLPAVEDRLVPVAGISGACLLVTRAAHEAVRAGSGEFFDEDFLAYREDAELAYRAALLGVPSYLCTGARGRHARSLRGTARGADPAIDRLGVRNRFLLAFKYGRDRPGVLPAALARDAVVVAGVLARERTSLPGLREAWALRHAMRAKGQRLRRAARTVTVRP